MVDVLPEGINSSDVSNVRINGQQVTESGYEKGYSDAVISDSGYDFNDKQGKYSALRFELDRTNYENEITIEFDTVISWENVQKYDYSFDNRMSGLLSYSGQENSDFDNKKSYNSTINRQ
ncbi:hypothetical protein [Secundilactobacillus collinoides]|uniref:hypothetical protein n=1 Tax=Secundilactobacillus collinoides TaxID=33960 RepID=UPI0006D1321B|nr:hypothetical protein [Secundilactobacillus collinoides]